MSSPAPTRILLGILFMLTAGLLFPVMGGFAKLLGQHYSSLQISWARAFGHILFLSALFMPRMGLSLFRTRRPGLQLFRSAMLFTSNLNFFYAISFIPLAKAAAISLAAPLIVALLAWPMLGERTTRGRVIALLIGFLGVLVVIRPGSEVFQPASVLIVGSAFCYAVYQVFTRKVAGTDRPETSVMYSALVGTLVMTCVVPFVWVTPTNLPDIALHLALGCLGAGGHWCVAKAMTYGQANVISPFQYWQMIGSVIVGYIISGLFPDGMTWLGAGIIIAAGIAIAITETRRR